MRRFFEKYYLSGLIFGYCMLMGLIMFPAAVIWHAGESWSPASLVEHQGRHDALLAMGLFDYEIAYKKQLYKAQQPSVTIIGSSRTLQYHEEMFSKPFTNMGRGLKLHQIKEEVKFLAENPNLELVLWGFDYSNYNHMFCHGDASYDAAADAIGINSSNILKFSNLIPREALNIWGMIADGRISLPLFLKYASQVFSERNMSKNKLGLRTLYSNEGGYKKDGSYVYLSLFNDLDRLVQEREASITAPVPDGGVPLIAQNEKFCSQITSDIEYVHQYLKQRGIKLHVFLVPLPKRHVDLVMNIEHGRRFYDRMQAEFASLEPETRVEDYFMPARISFSDQEFIDQSHAGAVISYRILLDMLSRHKDMGAYINQNLIQERLKKCKGQPMCVDDFERYLIPEH